MHCRDQSSTKVGVRRRRRAAVLPAALLPIEVAMMVPLALLLLAVRELRVLRQCASQRENAVHGQQVAVRRLLETGLLQCLRALLAPQMCPIARIHL